MGVAPVLLRVPLCPFSLCHDVVLLLLLPPSRPLRVPFQPFHSFRSQFFILNIPIQITRAVCSFCLDPFLYCRKMKVAKNKSSFVPNPLKK